MYSREQSFYFTLMLYAFNTSIAEVEEKKEEEEEGESNTEIFIVIFYCYSLLRIQQLNHCPSNNEQIFSKLETCCLDEAGLLNSNLTAVI